MFRRARHRSADPRGGGDDPSALETSTGADPLVVGCAIGALHGGAQAYVGEGDDAAEARSLILRSVQLLLKESS